MCCCTKYIFTCVFTVINAKPILGNALISITWGSFNMIANFRLKMPVDIIVTGVRNLDTDVVSQDITEVLVQLLPSDEENQIFKKFENDRGDYESLPHEDIVLLKLSRIRRLSEKIKVLDFMSCFQVSIFAIS